MGYLYLEHIELSLDHLHPKLGFNHWWSDYLAYEKRLQLNWNILQLENCGLSVNIHITTSFR